MCTCCRAASLAAHGAYVRQLTALEWVHEPALQSALEAAGGLGPPAEIRPEVPGGWALRARRSHLLQVSHCHSLLPAGASMTSLRELRWAPIFLLAAFPFRRRMCCCAPGRQPMAAMCVQVLQASVNSLAGLDEALEQWARAAGALVGRLQAQVQAATPAHAAQQALQVGPLRRLPLIGIDCHRPLRLRGLASRH